MRCGKFGRALFSRGARRNLRCSRLCDSSSPAQAFTDPYTCCSKCDQGVNRCARLVMMTSSPLAILRRVKTSALITSCTGCDNHTARGSVHLGQEGHETAAPAACLCQTDAGGHPNVRQEAALQASLAPAEGADGSLQGEQEMGEGNDSILRCMESSMIEKWQDEIFPTGVAGCFANHTDPEHLSIFSYFRLITFQSWYIFPSSPLLCN